MALALYCKNKQYFCHGLAFRRYSPVSLKGYGRLKNTKLKIIIIEAFWCTFKNYLRNVVDVLTEYWSGLWLTFSNTEPVQKQVSGTATGFGQVYKSKLSLFTVQRCGRLQLKRLQRGLLHRNDKNINLNCVAKFPKKPNFIMHVQEYR